MDVPDSRPDSGRLESTERVRGGLFITRRGPALPLRLLAPRYTNEQAKGSDTTMSDSALRDRGHASSSSPRFSDDSDPAVDADEVLAIFNDEHACAILRTIGDQALPAKAITEQVDSSRATVYRRLNRLEEAGVVSTTMAYHSEGHHREHYYTALDEVQLSFAGGDVSVEAVTADSANEHNDASSPFEITGNVS